MDSRLLSLVAAGEWGRRSGELVAGDGSRPRPPAEEPEVKSERNSWDKRAPGVIGVETASGVRSCSFLDMEKMEGVVRECGIVGVVGDGVSPPPLPWPPPPKNLAIFPWIIERGESMPIMEVPDPLSRCVLFASLIPVMSLTGRSHQSGSLAEARSSC